MSGAVPSKLGFQFTVNTNTLNVQNWSSTAHLAGGGFIVVWQDQSEAQGDPVCGIKAQRYGANGSPLGGEYRVTLTIGQYNVITGTPGPDQLVGTAGRDQIVGLAGADTTYGGAGSDVHYGGAGNDVLTDSGGDNIFYGEAGDDYVYGAPGADMILGGDGLDVLLGGGGDRFIMDAAKGGILVVQDFAPGSGDVVNFRASSIGDFAAAQQAMSYAAGINSTIITDAAGNAVWLIGIAPDQLDASMFSFA